MIDDWRGKWHTYTDGATAPSFPFGWVRATFSFAFY
jgi:hypothetical protein